MGETRITVTDAVELKPLPGVLKGRARAVLPESIPLRDRPHFEICFQIFSNEVDNPKVVSGATTHLQSGSVDDRA